MADHNTLAWARRVRLAALGALAVSVPGAVVAAGAASEPTGEIAYVCQTEQRAKLCIVNADGTAARGLTESHRGDVQGPAWSPDGQKIAFARRIHRNWSIYVLDLRSGRERRVVTSSVVAWNPTWSPDGRKLAFEMTVETRATVDREGVYVVNLSGSGLRRLTPTRLNAVMPSWSPDGRRIAYVRVGERGVITMWLMAPSGRRQHEMARNVRGRPAWSPDGKRLAFVNGRAEICVIRPDGEARRCLMKTRWINDRPTWSPDGQWIAFDRCVTERFLCEQVWLVSVDRNVSRRLTSPKPGLANRDPAWRPTGTG